MSNFPLRKPAAPKPEAGIVTAKFSVEFDSKFVAHPYWPEMYQVIEITKKSGMNRARASQNARKALEEHLREQGMTLAQYEKLKVLAARPFHTAEKGEIIIPASNVLSFIVAATDEARAAQRPCEKDQVRSRFRATDWRTGKFEQDGVWSRYSTVTSGMGGKLSNQRALRENAYIENFTATGSLIFDTQFVVPETLRNLIDWGGQFVGIGASRKMGCGRFKLKTWSLTH